MSIDLGALFDVARDVAGQLLDTSGTTLSIGRLSDGRGEGTVDPDTLAYSATDPDVIVDETVAFLAPVGGFGADVVLPGTATPVQLGDLLVLLPPAIVEVQEQDVLTVLSCVDARLVGREMDVLTLLDSSPGVVRLLHARLRTLGPGAS